MLTLSANTLLVEDKALLNFPALAADGVKSLVTLARERAAPAN